MIKPQRKVLVLSFIVSSKSFELFNNVMDTIGDYYIEIINTTDYKDYKEVVVRAIEEDACLYLEAMADFLVKECNTNTQAAQLNELSKPKTSRSLNRDAQPDRDWLLDEDEKAVEKLKSKPTSASGQAQDAVKTTIPKSLSSNQSLKELKELGSILALSWLDELFKK
jgi:hypothetical protein